MEIPLFSGKSPNAKDQGRVLRVKLISRSGPDAEVT